MDYTEIYPPRLVLCRDWKELQRCETTSRSIYGTSRQKSLCLQPMTSALVSKSQSSSKEETHGMRSTPVAPYVV